ncbi:STAS domain-containing protein [Chloroflexi bacterium CFX6]|nr:STAS domain-containing protein [Chloroflexi bacterium CFX6]
MDIKVSTMTGRVPVTIVHVEGNVDVSTADAFQANVLSLIEGGARHILVDMEHAPFMSSAGLRALHQIFNKLREVSADNVTDEEMRKGISEGAYKSPHLKLLNLSENTKVAFDTAGFDMFIETFTDRQTAINSF